MADNHSSSENRRKDAQSGVRRRDLLVSGTALVVTAALGSGRATQAQAQQTPSAPPTAGKPNILMVMADDIGWFNLSARRPRHRQEHHCCLH